MLNIKELEEMGKKAGFSYVALLKSDSIQLMPEVREMCKNNTCHMYALSLIHISEPTRH